MSIENSIVFTFNKPAPVEETRHEEGGPCVACIPGQLKFFSENCSCHVRAPCGSCENAVLKCDGCGEEFAP